MGNFGKYQLYEEIGRGGFGTVYKAFDEVLRRYVAIKILHPVLVANPSIIFRFKQEAQLLAQLDHPNLVPVFDFGEIEGRFFYAMKLMKGGSLKSLINAKGRLSQNETLAILRQICSGLSYAHNNGIIQRDLKPSNILFDEQGNAKISDLGFAKAVTGKESSTLSSSGGLVGTPAYMAPEVWKGQKASPSTDIYSLACIAYEMVAGKILFDGESTPEVMLKHFEPVVFDISLPNPWKKALTTALEKDPEKRFRTVKAFETAILQGFGQASAGAYTANKASNSRSPNPKNETSQQRNSGETRNPSSYYTSQPQRQDRSSPVRTVKPVSKPFFENKEVLFVIAVVVVIALVALLSNLNRKPEPVRSSSSMQSSSNSAQSSSDQSSSSPQNPIAQVVQAPAASVPTSTRRPSPTSTPKPLPTNTTVSVPSRSLGMCATRETYDYCIVTFTTTNIRENIQLVLRVPEDSPRDLSLLVDGKDYPCAGFANTYNLFNCSGTGLSLGDYLSAELYDSSSKTRVANGQVYLVIVPTEVPPSKYR